MRIDWDADAPSVPAPAQQAAPEQEIDVSTIDFDNAAHDSNRPFEEAALVLVQIGAVLETLKERERMLKRVVAYEFEEQAGEDTRSFKASDKTYTVTCKRTEKVSWDQDVLDQLVAGQVVPDYITKKLGVDAKRYRSLDAETKRQLEPARTVSLNAPTIKIEME